MATPSVPATATTLSGVAASPGIAGGTAVLWNSPDTHLVETHVTADDVTGQQARLDDGLQKAARELDALHSSVSGTEEQGIIAAHRAMLADPELRASLGAAIRDQLVDAATAVQRVLASQADALRASGSARIAERATDIDDLRQRLLASLGAVSRTEVELPEDAVVVATDLTPSQTIGLDRTRLRAFVLSGGGPTAHTTILARSLGIPAVVQVPGLDAVRNGAVLLVDGDQGTVTVDPDPAEVSQAAEAARRREDAAADALPQALTSDGHAIRLSANIGSADEAVRAHRAGARSVGLFRTEFVFLAGQELPGEEEQLAAYAGAVQALGGGRVTIRLLDVGGDKPLPPLTSSEANPMLGHRGVRLLLDAPEVLRTQLRAVLRAAAHGEVWVCVPMISGTAELAAVRSHLEEVRAELSADEVDHGPVKLGVMIETPAAVLAAAALARQADFFSIGTNDLLQYLVAADRDNGRVTHLLDAHTPALLHAIGLVVRAAHAHGITVSVCGEAASDPSIQPFLLGLGVDELSMTAARLPGAARSVAAVSSADAAALADRATRAEDADEVRGLLDSATSAAPVTAEPMADGGWAVTVSVTAPEGLHARPASQLVSAAQGFGSEVVLHVAGRQANAKAMLSVLGLGVDCGTAVRIEARGDDAHEAVTTLGTRLAARP
ncbi:phosphoenolpyruvate--protein phosphotransferase [Streptomyces roseicoloratus]|uniref:phosphoenolpyruvate--protein phosphotransferase n=1 Tax=Streptomyces roseicoloratus TaxID=2508722 RepID=UPI001009D59C|nr:phosphoenolpyruvate--protein phosphotransferase [Streptomyces roseicoloratus]